MQIEIENSIWDLRLGSVHWKIRFILNRFIAKLVKFRDSSEIYAFLKLFGEEVG